MNPLFYKICPCSLVILNLLLHSTHISILYYTNKIDQTRRINLSKSLKYIINTSIFMYTAREKLVCQQCLVCDVCFIPMYASNALPSHEQYRETQKNFIKVLLTEGKLYEHKQGICMQLNGSATFRDFACSSYAVKNQLQKYGAVSQSLLGLPPLFQSML